MLRPEDLQAIDNVLYEPKAEELTARQVISLKTDVHPGAEFYAYNVLSRSGVAKIIANAADDLPLVDADMKRETVQIYTIATGFQYTVQELRASQMAGTSPDGLKAGVARRAVAEKENQLAWIGDKKHNIQGLATATGIQIEAVPQNKAGNSSKWSDKTPAEIEEDIRLIRKKVTVLPRHGDSRNLYLMVPADQYEELDRRYSDYDARTIRVVIEGHNWFAGIVRVPDLKGVGIDGTDSIIVADTSPEVMQLLISMDLTRLDEEWKYPAWKVPVEERTGGVIIRYPLAIVRGDGI